MDKSWMATLLPLGIVALVFALRFRNLHKPKPFHPGRLWIMPVFVILAVGAALFGMNPSPMGWLVLAIGAAVGGFVGWKRGQLMHLDRDPETGGLLIRQSPAALILLIGIFAAKRLFSYGAGGEPGAAGHLTPHALLATDGLLGFALGMILLSRWTLWQRAQAVPPHRAEEA